MIMRKVSAAFLLRDGFTGAALSRVPFAECRIDGLPARPVFKDDGWIVFQDLEEGKHELQIRKKNFLPLVHTFIFEKGSMVEDALSLLPALGSPPPEGCTRLVLRLCGKGEASAGRTIWIGLPHPGELKLRQDSRERGGRVLKLFCRGGWGGVPAPQYYMALSGERAELLFMESFQDEEALLRKPLGMDFPRGTELRRAFPLRSDEEGEVRAVLKGGRISVLYDIQNDIGRHRELSLLTGTQELVIE